MDPICLPSCVSATKPKTGYTNGCGKKRAKGGIPRLLFLTCDPDYVHPVAVEEGVSPWTVPANITAAMCAGILNFTGPVLGSMPKATFVKKKMDSCGPEEIIGGNQTINFQDYNVTDDLEEYDFWTWIMENYPYMVFGWVTCDELMFLYDGAFAPEVAPVTEDTSDGSRFFDGTITMQTEQIIKPIRVPGILSLLANFDASTSCYS